MTLEMTLEKALTIIRNNEKTFKEEAFKVFDANFQYKDGTIAKIQAGDGRNGDVFLTTYVASRRSWVYSWYLDKSIRQEFHAYRTDVKVVEVLSEPEEKPEQDEKWRSPLYVPLALDVSQVIEHLCAIGAVGKPYTWESQVALRLLNRSNSAILSTVLFQIVLSEMRDNRADPATRTIEGRRKMAGFLLNTLCADSNFTEEQFNTIAGQLHKIFEVSL